LNHIRPIAPTLKGIIPLVANTVFINSYNFEINAYYVV
jgi:hypothetical protein